MTDDGLKNLADRYLAANGHISPDTDGVSLARGVFMLLARLHTLEQERDAAQGGYLTLRAERAVCDKLIEAMRKKLEAQVAALGPPVPVCPHCQSLKVRWSDRNSIVCEHCDDVVCGPIPMFRQVTGQP